MTPTAAFSRGDPDAPRPPGLRRGWPLVSSSAVAVAVLLVSLLVVALAGLLAAPRERPAVPAPCTMTGPNAPCTMTTLGPAVAFDLRLLGPDEVQFVQSGRVVATVSNGVVTLADGATCEDALRAVASAHGAR